MVRAPAHFDARGRPDTKASPGLPRRAGLLAALDLARDEVGLRRQRRSTISLFPASGARRSGLVRDISESLAFAQNFRFKFQTAKSCISVIASAAKQSTTRATVKMDCFVALLLA